MEQGMDEFIYINDIELFTLLASFGKEKWYGINSDTNIDDYSPKNANEVIVSLYQKGYISMQNNVAKISKDLSEILTVLINSNSYIYIRRKQSHTPVLMFYLCENKGVYVERSVNEKDTLKLSCIEIDALKRFIIEECFEDDLVPPEAESLNPEKSISFNDEITEELIFSQDYASVIEKFSSNNGKMTDRFILQDVGLYHRIYLQSEISEFCMENTKEKQEYISEILTKK